MEQAGIAEEGPCMNIYGDNEDTACPAVGQDQHCSAESSRQAFRKMFSASFDPSGG